MNNTKVNSLDIISAFENNKFKVGIVSVSRLHDLRNYMDNLYNQGIFDATFYEERLNHFDYDITKVFANGQSIIIATKSQPICCVRFLYGGAGHDVIVPPTYDNITDKMAFSILSEILEPEGYRFSKINLPEKLLLVFCGIAKYGRNNITYVDGMGSFHRPVVFITDAGLEELEWRNPESHEKCNKCKICFKYCPTGAIANDRFLLKAERCLTYHNERDFSFPEWIKSEWHNSLIGCMLCQNVCPLNKDYVGNIENVVSFSEQETLQILKNSPITDLSPGTTDKLKKLNLIPEYNLLGRNLSALINRCNP